MPILIQISGSYIFTVETKFTGIVKLLEREYC